MNIITQEEIEAKEGETILFKERDINYTADNKNNPLGILITRKSDGKVKCNECGKYFEFLSSHLRKHYMTTRKYKRKYSMNITTALCSKASSQQRANVMKLRIKNGFIPFNGKKPDLKKGQARQGINFSMEYKNKRKVCPAQMEQRMKLFLLQYGQMITMIEATTIDKSLVNWGRKTYGTWAETKKAHISKTNLKDKHLATLIFSLREYIRKWETLPWDINNKLNGFSFDMSMYESEFGSQRKAWVICGIKKQGEKWIVYG